MADWYISPTGNDSTGDGSSGNPWATLSKAFAGSGSGDNIHLLSGTYTNNLITSSPLDWTSDRQVIGDSGYAATIWDDGYAASQQMRFYATVTFTGITFRKVKTTSARGIFQSADASCVLTLTNCWLDQLEQGDTGGIGNIVNAMEVSGSALGSTTLDACLITNPTYNGTAAGTAFFGCGSQNVAGTWTLSVINCTYYTNVTNANTLVMFDVAESASNTVNVTLTNNIIWNANGTNRTWNLVGGTVNYSGSNNDILGWTSPPSLSNQLATDPLFVDSANSNYNLRPTSPCIGAGTLL